MMSKQDAKERAGEAVRRYTLTHATMMKLSDAAEESRSATDKLDQLVVEMQDRTNEEENEAVRALLAAGGVLVIDGVKITALFVCGKGLLRMEPLGDFGVRSPQPREAVPC